MQCLISWSISTSVFCMVVLNEGFYIPLKDRGQSQPQNTIMILLDN